MTKDNMELWNKVKQPPKSALKKIKGGRLTGMTDINPMWRIQALTEQFGRCGVGWHFKIDANWVEDGADGVKMAFAQVSLYIGGVDTPVVGVGGSTLVAKEKDRATGAPVLHNNDEAYKMAVTDALGTAMKMIGVAADIYAGKWDGSKYNEVEEKIPVTPISSDLQKEKHPKRGQEEYDSLDDMGKLKITGSAERIKQLFMEGTDDSKEQAFMQHVFGINEVDKMALWYVLQPQSTIRNTLRQMAERKALE